MKRNRDRARVLKCNAGNNMEPIKKRLLISEVVSAMLLIPQTCLIIFFYFIAIKFFSPLKNLHEKCIKVREWAREKPIWNFLSHSCAN